MELLLIIVFAFGFFVGDFFATVRFKKLLIDIADQAGFDLLQELKDERKTNVRRLETEVVGDVMYLYDKETRDFICQASSINELAKLANEYKNVDKALVTHNNRLFMFVDGTSEEYNES